MILLFNIYRYLYHLLYVLHTENIFALKATFLWGGGDGIYTHVLIYYKNTVPFGNYLRIDRFQALLDINMHKSDTADLEDTRVNSIGPF